MSLQTAKAVENFNIKVLNCDYAFVILNLTLIQLIVEGKQKK